MIDWHVHTGQWHEIYCEPEFVVKVLKATGTEEFWFSSTTSGRLCKESVKVKDDIEAQKTLPTARELYEFIRAEISTALDVANKIGAKAHPLYWVVPEVHFSDVANVESAMNDLPYEGFKLHPRANVWDLSDKKTAALAEEVFSYAEKKDKMILIHCGPDPFELPTLFEDYIKRYPKVTVQLAHCRPLEDTLYMLKTYPNTVCDTAFVSAEDQKRLRDEGFTSRIRYGTDFPITYYFAKMPDHNPAEEELIEFLKLS
ncbi:MAG: amidohydrolase family protein [Treponema sp.]|nr:amidohydrolase family protein [Treponema sp.]